MTRNEGPSVVSNGPSVLPVALNGRSYIFAHKYFSRKRPRKNASFAETVDPKSSKDSESIFTQIERTFSTSISLNFFTVEKLTRKSQPQTPLLLAFLILSGPSTNMTRLSQFTFSKTLRSISPIRLI